MVASVKVFDPRRGTWMSEASMNHSRGYSAAVVLNDRIYAIGGMGGNENVLDKVERYQEGLGWQVTNLKAVGIGKGALLQLRYSITVNPLLYRFSCRIEKRNPAILSGLSYVFIGKLKCDPQTHAGYLIKVGPLAAKNLIAGNVNGTSDPYALVTRGTEKRFR
uniref:Uncharacterized protein n=1 Tax=Chenopodium quinoa TaxID=63459 RepID=A0A803N6Z8_CHEQI